MNGDKKQKQKAGQISLLAVTIRGFPGCSHKSSQIVMSKTGNVPVNVTLRRVRVTTVVVEKQ
jgi:hypothetical protein